MLENLSLRRFAGEMEYFSAKVKVVLGMAGEEERCSRELSFKKGGSRSSPHPRKANRLHQQPPCDLGTSLLTKARKAVNSFLCQ